MAQARPVFTGAPTDRPALVGVVHLPPLPGSPRFAQARDACDGDPHRAFETRVIEPALADAKALAEGGVDAIIVENFGDAPFFADAVPPETVAAMAAAARAVRQACGLPLGVNVLRNDAASALAVAAASGASFVRVNVLAGAAVTDQGVIQGKAAAVMRQRAALGLQDVKVWADVLVKHASPLVGRPLEEELHELLDRSLADAVIATGAGTGRATDAGLVHQVRELAGDTPVLVGSGVTDQTASAYPADGLIVGTWLKHDGRLFAPVDPDRVRRLRQRL
ncbi:MAG: BtpA/SgcQ family protein [Planctomycetota bacterium]